jgi:hypothetical protein
VGGHLAGELAQVAACWGAPHRRGSTTALPAADQRARAPWLLLLLLAAFRRRRCCPSPRRRRAPRKRPLGRGVSTKTGGTRARRQTTSTKTHCTAPSFSAQAVLRQREQAAVAHEQAGVRGRAGGRLAPRQSAAGRSSPAGKQRRAAKTEVGPLPPLPLPSGEGTGLPSGPPLAALLAGRGKGRPPLGTAVRRGQLSRRDRQHLPAGELDECLAAVAVPTAITMRAHTDALGEAAEVRQLARSRSCRRRARFLTAAAPRHRCTRRAAHQSRPAAPREGSSCLAWAPAVAPDPATRARLLHGVSAGSGGQAKADRNEDKLRAAAMLRLPPPLHLLAGRRIWKRGGVRRERREINECVSNEFE